MNLFIDTNIYLNFYHFSSDDLEELKKLSVAIQNNKIVLYVPEQVIFEFKRNRESKILDALKRLDEQEIPDQFPQIYKGYKEFPALRETIKQFNKTNKEILVQLNEDIENNCLGADKVISKLFSHAKTITLDDKFLMLARKRAQIGNPPGKANSYGDAINWEILIDSIPEWEDIYFITEDKDYMSPINESNLSQFLLEEWKKRKHSNIFFYKKLSDFFKDNFPDIKLASEFEKEIAISNLVNSGSFASTHVAIGKLSIIPEFSNIQINEIVNACLTNDQVNAVKDDIDVKNFFVNLLKNKENIIDKDKIDKILVPFESSEPAEGDEIGELKDIPF